MIAQVANRGNSLALRIPNALAQTLDLKEGRSVELRVEGERLIVLTSRKVKFSFDTEVPQGSGIVDLVIADQVSSRSWTQRRSRFIGVAPRVLVDDVTAKFKALLP